MSGFYVAERYFTMHTLNFDLFIVASGVA